MADLELNRVSLHDWEVEVLRATAFFTPESEISPQNWWKDTVGSEPETQVFQARTAEHTFQGLVLNGQLTLRVQPQRIDWMLGVPPPLTPEAPAVHSIGRFDEACAEFAGLASRWFHASCPTLLRVAFGGITTIPVANREVGYRQLVPYLPAVKIDPEKSSDLLYRINRKRDSESGIQNLEINRLSTWSVQRLEYQQIKIDAGRAVVLPGEQSFLCRTEIDINTGLIANQTFSQEQSATVFDELVKLGQEIIEKGDIP